MNGMATADLFGVVGGLERPQPRVARPVRLLVALAVFVSAIALLGADGWFRGGTFLVRNGLTERVGPQAVGVPVSFGVDLETRGSGGVVLEAASANYTGDVAISYRVVYTAPDADGVGTFTGSISLANTVPVRGAKVEEPGWRAPAETCTTGDLQGAVPVQCTPSLRNLPRHGAFWLVVTVTPARPGPWTITDIRVTYRSWWRSRASLMNMKVTGTATPS